MPTAHTPLPPHELAQRLAALGHWQHQPASASITRRFTFEDFAQAFGFMAEMATVSERMNHHPEWFNVYNRVDVTLTTHDAGGLTALDLAWAERASQVAARFTRSAA